MFGPTRGDRLRLGDTSLWIEIERDLIEERGGLGDELKFGGGKTVREGMGQRTGMSDKETLDMVVTNAVVIDWNGIYKVNSDLVSLSPSFPFPHWSFPTPLAIHSHLLSLSPTPFHLTSILEPLLSCILETDPDIL